MVTLPSAPRSSGGALHLLIDSTPNLGTTVSLHFPPARVMAAGDAVA